MADPPWRKSDSPVTPPAAPDSVSPGTAAVDLTKAYDPNGFRKDVTQDQRIHVHIDLGRVFESQGNFDAALSEYQQALAACEQKGIGRSRSADEALAQRRIGNAYDRLGRFAQAELHYKKALRLSSRDPRIWNDVGYSYYLQGRWADAERTLKTGMKHAPEDIRLKTNLGLTLAAAGRTRRHCPYSASTVAMRLATPTWGSCSLRPARWNWLASNTFRPWRCVPAWTWPAGLWHNWTAPRKARPSRRRHSPPLQSADNVPVPVLATASDGEWPGRRSRSQGFHRPASSTSLRLR